MLVETLSFSKLNAKRKKVLHQVCKETANYLETNNVKRYIRFIYSFNEKEELQIVLFTKEDKNQDIFVAAKVINIFCNCKRYLLGLSNENI